MLRYKYRKIFMTIIISLLLTGCANQQSENVSVVKYEDKEYVELEYPQSIFYYDYNGNPHDNFEEVDGIYPIDSPKWEVIWNGGDLYCIKDRAEEAKEYYASDANYVWYLFIGDTRHSLHQMQTMSGIFLLEMRMTRTLWLLI